ncbi:MAG TPA: PQQ-dependent sugar dehydrogenase [Solirubrobacterales bacterium]|nr:PQQ-dependent sugar dehydrogenase [Solirubrobacterales bacterium]
MRRRAAASALTAALLALVLPACGSADQSRPPDAGAARAGGGIALKKVGQFDHPVYVTGAPGFPQLLFVVEQPGRVAVLSGGHRLSHAFLDIRGMVGYDEAERGLLSIAFPPDYRQSGSFYVYYVNKAGNIRIDEFKRASGTRADTGSQRQVIEIPHPVNANHNGGQMQFLGNLLYFGTGDGGSGGDPPNNAQNKDVLLGKLLRIDPRPAGGAPYSVPPTNPFVGAPGRDEIYSYGLRNPFRFSFDTVSAKQPRIAIGDVGQNRFEELDYTTVAAAGGANFGWDALEGFAPYTEENSGTPDPGGTTRPIFAYSHSRAGSCSIIGGYVVADPHLRSLYKRYLYADLCEGQLRSLVPHLKRAGDDRKVGLAVESPTSFGEDDAHHVYVSSLSGPVYRLVQK